MDSKWPYLALIAGSVLIVTGCGVAAATPRESPVRHAAAASSSYQEITPPSSASVSNPSGGAIASASGSAASGSVGAAASGSATSGSVGAAASGSAGSGYTGNQPDLTITEVGWDYSADSPAVWVEATDNLAVAIDTLRVRATFVNPANNEALGSDTEYLAGAGFGSGSATLEPGQSSVPVEVDLLLRSVLPVPVNAELEWSWLSSGGWHSWKTVAIPGGPPPGPFTNLTTEQLPTPARNVLNFVPESSVSTILSSVMLVTGHNNHLSGSAFVGTVTEVGEPGGMVDVTWSVPVAASALSGSVVSGNPAVFQFAITSGGSTLSALNGNAEEAMAAMQG